VKLQILSANDQSDSNSESNNIMVRVVVIIINGQSSSRGSNGTFIYFIDSD
jgi:hypothetical protein